MNGTHKVNFIALAIQTGVLSLATLPGSTAGAIAPTARDYVQTGLIAHWDGIENVGYGLPHDSTATVWKDLTGRHDLTGVEGNYSWQDNAFYASAQNSQVATSVARASTSITAYRTVEVVFEAESSIINSGSKRCIFSSGNKYRFLWCHFNGTKRIQFCEKHPSLENVDFTVHHHVAATYAGTDSDANTTVDGLYLDGQQQTAGSYDETWGQFDSVFALGYGRNSAYSFRGKIYAIRLYDRELTADEIAANAAIDSMRFFGASANVTHRWTGAAGTGKWDDAGNWQTPSGTPALVPPHGDSIVEIVNNVAGSVLEIKLPKSAPELLGLMVGGVGEVRFSRASPHNDWTSHRLTARIADLGASTVLTLDEGVAITGWSVARGELSVGRGAYTGNGELGDTVDWLGGKGTLAVGNGLRMQDFGDTTRLYVQDGLISLWDGLENAGRGVRDPLAPAWKDLAGTNDLTLLDCGSWEGNWLKCVGASGKFAAQGAGKISNAKTIEIVYRETGRATDIQVVLDLGCGGRFVVHNYRNGYVQFSTASGPAPALTSDQYHDYDILAAATFSSTDGGAAATAAYLNGDPSEGTYAEGWNTIGKVSIGKCSNANRVFTGRVYAIRLYDRELSPKEIARNAAYDRYRFFGGERPVIPGVCIILR